MIDSAKQQPHIDCVLPPIEQCLFLPIDVQREFCDPLWSEFNRPRGTDQTDQISLKISKIAPLVRQSGMDVGWVFFTSDFNLLSTKPENAFAGFHHVQPAYEQDAFFPKTNDSAFQTNVVRHAFSLVNGPKKRTMPLKKFIKRHNKTTLLTCGFNLTACVSKTVCDAMRQGHDVVMITDLCANDSYNPNAGNIWNTFRQYVNDAQTQASSPNVFGQCHYINSETMLSKLGAAPLSLDQASAVPISSGAAPSILRYGP